MQLSPIELIRQRLVKGLISSFKIFCVGNLGQEKASSEKGNSYKKTSEKTSKVYF